MATEDEKPEDLTAEDQIEAGEAEAEEESAELPDETGDEGGDFSEEELEALTDEERAALAEDDGDADEADEDQDADPGQQPDAQPDPEPAASQEPPAPAPVKVDPAVTAQILEKAKADKKALFAQYEDGELTRDQYLAGLEKIDTESADAAARAALEVQEEQREYELWTNAAKTYLSEVPGLASEDHLAAFDAHVRRVTNDPASAKLTYRQMLEKAHRYYLADQPEVKTPIPSLPGAKPAPKAETTRAQRAEPPITLAKIPAAVPSAVSDGRYGQLQKAIDDATTAEEVERIMAGMSEAEREAFASMDV